MSRYTYHTIHLKRKIKKVGEAFCEVELKDHQSGRVLLKGEIYYLSLEVMTKFEMLAEVWKLNWSYKDSLVGYNMNCLEFMWNLEVILDRM